MMANIFQDAKVTGLAAYLPATKVDSLEKYEDTYTANRHRVYSLCFWMLDNELQAEELTGNVFRRVFARTADADAETVDKALIAELRELMTLGTLSLHCGTASEVAAIRRNTMRVHLERAVVQLPPTEKLVFLLHDVEGYDQGRITRLLGLSEKEATVALHQSRLRIRELIAKMLE